EGALACVAIVRDGTVITPSTTSGILESLTRRMVLDQCADLGIPTVEREVDRTELYIADEASVCGTGAEATPPPQVDGYHLRRGAATSGRRAGRCPPGRPRRAARGRAASAARSAPRSRPACSTSRARPRSPTGRAATGRRRRG